MSGTSAELIAEARGGYSGQEWVKDHHPHSAVGLALRLADALETAEAERDAALAVVAGVAAVIAKLAEHIDNPEDISEYWREAFDATDDIEDILSEASK